MENKEAIALLEKYENGSITKEELAVLEGWYHYQASKGNVVISDEELEANLSGIWNMLPQSEDETPKMRRLWPAISVAAAVLVIFTAGIYFYTANFKPVQDTELTASINDIGPGGNKAYLTLSNGKRISLNDVSDGNLVQQGGVTITKTADGQLVYQVLKSNQKNENLSSSFNTIETPNGGQYQVLLPDGTKVWLNAASTLKYPLSFEKKERKIELSGEGYFEVAKDIKRPFKIKTQRQEVTVLGTHFNVNSYKDEQHTTTTLLEGAVRIMNYLSLRKVVLRPNDQAVQMGKEIDVQQVNAEDAIAWKNGDFLFNDEPLESIMRKISRWYDVTIEYRGINPQDRFGGAISRFENVSKVLEKLELTGGIHFKIVNKKIIVSN